MNVPVEIVAVVVAAMLGLLGWIVRKLNKIETTLALVALRLGVVENKQTSYEKLNIRIAGRPALGRLRDGA